VVRFLLRDPLASRMRLHVRNVTLLAFLIALLGFAKPGFSQPANIAQVVPSQPQIANISDEASIEELIDARIKEEMAKGGKNFHPEMVQTEANYIRLSAASKDVLYESSFHLQPHYYYHAATGPDTNLHGYAEQPIMYYVGTARTPLALPVVSNLSTALPGNEASYTVNIGVLPLPPLSSESKDSSVNNSDSMRYYIVIERTLESNHTDNSVRMEQFQKNCSTKAGEPVNMRLANERLVKGAIVKLENGAVLDFDDDFSRFIEEHILIESDKLAFKLGHQTVSDISQRLSIPYSVARTCIAKVELLSVVDTAHPLTIIDTLRQPADYLAEVDLSKFADGPYQYRYSAIELGTGKTLFSETHDFNKTSPITVNEGTRIGSPDTLVVGRKKLNYDSLLNHAYEEIANVTVINDRINASLSQSDRDKRDLEQAVRANEKTSIADVHGRFGLGIGTAAGDNCFIGIESNRPALSFDVSFGWLYAAAPYLNYTPPLINQFFTSSKSLGFQLQWIPVKWFNGIIEPLVGLAYYGLWSSAQTSLNSAALLSGQIGIASEPWGEVHGVGFSLTYGPAFGLGLQPKSVSDLSFKCYTRF
jgi:hypothetical protein